MICAYCFGAVTWRGPLSNLTHTECKDCGRTNCQQVDEAVESADPGDDEPEERTCNWCDGTGIDGIDRGEGRMPRCGPCKGKGSILIEGTT